jgi:glyoxalase/bleomycin resistance protein/dioxygenase superfamily protein
MTSPKPLITGTDFITVATNDFDAAIDFYGSVLGLPESKRWGNELESRGVEFKGETIDSGVCYQAFFEDPDGNTLAIHHRYKSGAPPQAAGKSD